MGRSSHDPSENQESILNMKFVGMIKREHLDVFVISICLKWKSKSGKRQPFVQDIMQSLGLPDLQWKGPSWDCLYHAVFNQRPISIITARGHSAETLRSGIYEFVKAGYLPMEPNYLSLFAVSNKDVRKQFGDHEFKASTAELKQKAIQSQC
jgi:hypothetical protein